MKVSFDTNILVYLFDVARHIASRASEILN